MVGLSWVGTDNVPCVSKEDRRCKPGTIQCGTHVEEDDTGTKERERETIKTNICDRLGWVTHTRIIKTWFKKEISRIPPPPFWQKMVGWIHMLFIKWDGIFCRKKKNVVNQSMSFSYCFLISPDQVEWEGWDQVMYLISFIVPNGFWNYSPLNDLSWRGQKRSWLNRLLLFLGLPFT